VSADPSAHRSNGGRRRFRLFRKCLLGYNPIEVHEAIDARDSAIGVRDAMVHEAGERARAAESRVGADREELQARRAEAAQATRRIDELEHVAARLATMVVDRDRELRRARAELQAALERDDDGVRAFAAIAEELETVRRQARTQATRIRLRALREAAELAERVEDVEGAEGEARGRLIERLEEAIDRVGVEVDEDAEELAARRLVRRTLASTTGLDAQTRWRRTVAALGRRGYAPGLVSRLVREELVRQGEEAAAELEGLDPAG
jgi:regulatory protein